jgi:long-chain acyl-CoA synthetase
MAELISGDRRRTLEDAAVRAARAATGLASLGLGRLDSVALMLRNDFAFFEASMAAGMLGAYPVPVNWHYTGDEAGYVIRDCGAKALVVHADLLARIEDDVPAGVRVLVVETPEEIRAAYGLAPEQGRPPEDALAWDDWLAGFEPMTPGDVAAPGTMIYTSGTTGRPKGVRRSPPTPEQTEAFTEVLLQVFGLRAGARVAITGPMYHSAPNAYGMSAANLGGDVILQPRFDPEDLLALIDAHRVTHMHMVPTMFVRLLKLPDAVKAKYDLSSLEFVVHAAAPCPPDVKQRMIEWWGPVINEYYGATETGAVVFCTSEEWLAHPGTVGRALPHADVQVLDDDGRPLPANETGEIACRLHTIADFTYHGDDAKRADADRAGLVAPGDVGYLDEDGFLFISDRKKDMVISGGVNIYPAEIEAVLIDMPGVHDCGVFGIPDDEFGESLCAAVQPEDGAELDADAVRAWLRERVAGYKVPRVVDLHAELPREDSGKIFKRKLREPYWEDAGRQV